MNESVYTRVQLRVIAFNVAELYPPPTLMVMKQIEVESGFQNDLESHTGCIGLCQINPHDALKPGYGILPCADPLSPRDAVAYLCSYLICARARFAKSQGHMGWGRALLAYNVGMSGDPGTASDAYLKLAAWADAGAYT